MSPRAIAMLKKVCANLLGSMVSGAAGLVAIPVYLRMFGDAEYGRFVIVWIVIGYCGVFQMGIGRAIANGIAATTDRDVRKDYSAFGNAVLALAGLLAAGCFVMLQRVAIRVSGGLGISLSSADIGAVAVVIVFNTMSSGWLGTLEGTQQFGLINVLSSIAAVAGQVSPLLWCWVFGTSLQELVLGSAVARMLGLSAYLLCGSRVVAWPARLSDMKRYATSVVGFGLWSSLGSTLVPLIGSLDKIVIAKWQGIGSVPYYSVPFTLTSRLQVIPNSVARVVFPVLSRDPHRRTLFRDATMAVTAGFAIVVVVVMWAMRWWLVLWVGTTFADAAYVPSVLLCLGMWVNGTGFVPHVYLEAQRRPDVPTKVVLGAVPLYVAGVVIGARGFGVDGVIAAWLGLQVVMTVALLIACRMSQLVDIAAMVALAVCVAASVAAEVWVIVPAFVTVMTTVAVGGTMLVLIGRQYVDRMAESLGGSLWNAHRQA